MNSKRTLTLAVASVVLSIMSTAATAFDWKACNADLKKHCSAAKDDDKIFACLEKVEKKLSKACYDAHEKFEKEAGKTDKDEEHEK